MSRAILIACWPWLATFVVALLAMRGLIHLRGRNENAAWSRLLSLHRDQTGAVQSLSFVLTLPIFVILMLLIVQISQVMIGLVVVHYAAFAAVRAAVVWIPANVADSDEPANCISARAMLGGQNNGTRYRIAPQGPKFEKIRGAAVLACAPLAPSRNLAMAAGGDRRAEILTSLGQTLSPTLARNTRLAQRLQNKIAYSDQATTLELTFFHSDAEPPLVRYYEWVDEFGQWHWYEFNDHELGWQDTITATVTHDFALLPGPARVLARPATSSTTTTDTTAAALRRRGQLFVLPLTASASLGNEGEKSVLPYAYSLPR